MTKNVTVTDKNGNYVGTTYPKRAKGLVKNGRALFVDDCTIRLSAKAEPSDDKSEVKQMNYIYFNPRGWSSEQAERSFVNDFDGSLVEVLMFGNWNNYAKVFSNHFSLTPNTDYCFVFWLNGGENESGDETCQLKIVFCNNENNCYTYKLNRNYIRPLLHTQGWELYSIPFSTPGVEPAQETLSTVTAVDTQFVFVTGKAPMAIKPAKEPDFYKDWKDEPDEFAKWRPQRHNIVFEDGWPSLGMYGGNKYSTEVLRAKREKEKQTSKAAVPDFFNFSQTSKATIPEFLNFIPESFNFNVSAPEFSDSPIADRLRSFSEHYKNIIKTIAESYLHLRERADRQRHDDGDGFSDVEDALNDVEDALDDLEDALNDVEDSMDDALDELESRLDELESDAEED